MQLRPATPADVDPALALWQRCLAADGLRPGRLRLAEMRAQLTAADALLVVADQSAHAPVTGPAPELAGMALALVEPPEVAVSVLCVRPELRRRGTGTALLEAVADAAYLRGARRLTAQAADGAGFLLAAGLRARGELTAPDGGRVVQYDAELDPPMQDLAVRDDALRLGQLLKLAGLVDTGAQAKALLVTGTVRVNGEVEVRRGRQLAPGDVVVAEDRGVRVVPA